jgi:hypothetical protein
MTGLAMAIAVVLAALLFGAQLLSWLRLAPDAPCAHLLAGFGLGMVFLAYAILILGLLSLLTLPWLLAIVLLMIGCGIAQWRLLPSAIRTGAAYLALVGRSVGAKVLIGFAVLWVLLTLGASLLPPNSADWDGLSQHLAQAWTYAHEGCVRPLWHDHHSQFPCTMQMLYTTGMLADGYVTARLLHWLMGLFTVAWAVLIAHHFLGDKHKHNAVGLWAGFVVMSTPAFTWLTGVCYVDLGQTFFTLASLYFFLRWAMEYDETSLLLCALMLAGGMTVKMQGLALAGVFMLASAILTLRQRRSIRPWLAATVVLIVLGGPWYLKSYLLTGNPVYPFAYELFGGKLWSPQQAEFYEVHQLAFGYGEMPPWQPDATWWQKRFVGPREPYKWLIGPLMLTIRPWDFAVNPKLVFQSLLVDWIGPLYLPLLLVLLLLKRPPVAGVLLWMLLPLWLWWFFSMQYSRYLLPSLLLVAPLAGYVLSVLTSRQGAVRAATITLVCVWAVASLAQPMLDLTMAGTAISGQMSWEGYLRAQLDVYEPSTYISRYLPEDAIVATYGEPRSYYFQRLAIWADPGHSRLFEYEKMCEPDDLVCRYHELGVTHVLINRMHVDPFADESDWLLELLRRTVEEGLLEPITAFPACPYFLLLRIADTISDAA